MESSRTHTPVALKLYLSVPEGERGSRLVGLEAPWCVAGGCELQSVVAIIRTGRHRLRSWPVGSIVCKEKVSGELGLDFCSTFCLVV